MKNLSFQKSVIFILFNLLSNYCNSQFFSDSLTNSKLKNYIISNSNVSVKDKNGRKVPLKEFYENYYLVVRNLLNDSVVTELRETGFYSFMFASSEERPYLLFFDKMKFEFISINKEDSDIQAIYNKVEKILKRNFKNINLELQLKLFANIFEILYLNYKDYKY